MLGNLLNVANAALRSPYGQVGATAGVLPRQINPTVRRAEPGGASYTPAATPNPAQPLYNRTGGLNTSGYQAVSQAVSYGRSDTFDLSIRTADGDIATFSISQQQNIDTNWGAASVSDRNGRASAQELILNTSDTLAVNLSVQGDLSAEETASINALVSQVNTVAEDFFAGDLEQATQGARQISFGPDDASLSAYSFSLQSQESLRVVAMYESVAEFGPASPSAQASAPPPKADFLQSLRAMLDDLARSAKVMAT
jgi:hypothetical protein